MEAAHRRQHAPSDRRGRAYPSQTTRSGAEIWPSDAPEARRGGPHRHLLARSRKGGDQDPRPQLRFPSRANYFQGPSLRRHGHSLRPHGDYWRQLRKLCTLEVLSARRVRSFSHIREEETSDVVERISLAAEYGTPVNLTDMLGSLTNSISCRAISSCRVDDTYRKKFVSVLEDAINLGSGFTVTDLFPSFGFIDVIVGVKRRLERSRLRFSEMMDEIIEEHRERTAKRRRDSSCAGGDGSGVEDLVDVLLRIKDDDDQLEVPLTVDNIKAVIFDMFSGGTETTSTTLTWAMAELVRNPEAMEKVQTEVRQILKGKAKIHEDDDIGELQYLKLVIKETLRLHPPLPLLLPRACGETCEMGGYTIPAGARVMINAWALGRDPGVWDDAEAFRPERFDGSSADFKGADHGYLPFGSGRRMCPGITFGLATVELVLATLLYHFNWELPGRMQPGDLDMTDTFGITARKAHDLLLHAKLVRAW
ncbi:premnaspirodiene oxygenase-like [Iris pallida]|uniref:Premnaspirodiene oxygenase-like n=1 Tax=Iris pallida TaxID=29817 RepID=A0AAX6F6P4_IRIPA|nr:premnaspirodiene oxygenase-like [Iris pallida]KAJ6811908.1 premnaspirodiene oxygenase-like [Iris pallida]KAJ6829372.1 premnaspirodiene oxygenase-like [Iris pallida]